MTDLDMLRRLQVWFATDDQPIPGDDLDKCAACLSDAIKEIEASRSAFKTIRQDADECLKLIQRLRFENMK